MKALYILIIVALFSIKLDAQKKFSFTPSIGIAANVVSSNGVMVSADNYQFETESNFGYNLNASVLFEYALTDKFSLGIKPSYQYQAVNIMGDYDYSVIPEILGYIRHDIKSHIIKIPLVLKYRISRFYIVGEYGLTSVLHSDYDINKYSYGLHSPNDIKIRPVNSGSTDLTNNNSSIGQFFGIGFGRELKLWDKDFIIEIEYNQDINEWLYTPEEPDYTNEITFRNHAISLSFGIRI